ncbi:hypothetical protein GS534_00645 [Rhodococcus hoagii]|nr:hypothetical protein [Prescottella equi]
MNELLEFLRARFADEERESGLLRGEQRELALREVFALRRIVGRARQVLEEHPGSALADEYTVTVLPNLAFRYAGHPDFREDWT